MTSATWKSGPVLAALVTIAACSGNPQTPTAPSAAAGGTTTAAADGSTLKVSAPSLIAPIGGARVDTLRPTLTWAASSGTYAASTPETYDIEVTANGAVVFSGTATGTTYQSDRDTDFDTTYTWRARARQDGAVGPWSAVATFQSPENTGRGGVTSGFRAPDPAPGTRLPLPNEAGLVNDEYNRNYDDWRNSCQETQGERGWVWLDKLIDRLRTRDLRWGYNGKRGNLNDLSLDIVNYHYGAGESFGSTQVYIIDVLFSHCGNSPSPAWIDQTSATSSSGTIGRWGYPRSGHAAYQP